MIINKFFYIAIFSLLICTNIFANDLTAIITDPISGTILAEDSTITISGTVTGDIFSNYEMHFVTGNNFSWSNQGISIFNVFATTENGILGTWDTTSLNLTSWKLRLTVYANDQTKKIYYVTNVVDTTSPAISQVTFNNLSTGDKFWVKNGDGLQLFADISDDYLIATENLWVDFSSFGGSKYSLPSTWETSPTGVASWLITTNIETNGVISLNIFIQDFGNNYVSINLVTTADYSLPSIDVFVDNIPLFSGDFLQKEITISAYVTDNYDIESFSLYFYNNDSLISTTSNHSGVTLSLFIKDLDNSRQYKVVAVASDLAGNIITENFTKVAVVEDFILTEVLPAPNPFNPNNELLHIGYKVSIPGIVKLYLHSITGERVYTEKQESHINNNGYNEFVWDGRNQYGKLVPNGFYFGVIVAEDNLGTKKKELIKIAVLK